MNCLAERLRTATPRRRTGRCLASLALLATMAAGPAAAGARGEDWRVQFIYRYSFDSDQAADAGSFGFNLDRGPASTVPAPPVRLPAAALSCVDCTDADYRRFAIVYGLLLVVGYQVVKEALDD